MVTSRLERRFYAAKENRVVVRYHRCFSVHERGRIINPATVGLSNRLVTKADAQNRDAARCLFYKLKYDPRFLGTARSGRQHYTFRF